MSFQSWLQNLRSTLTPGLGQRHPAQRGSPRAGTHRLHLEVLEERLTPSTFTWDGTYSSEPPPEVVWASSPSHLVDCTSDGIRDRIELIPYQVVVRPGRGDGTFGDPIRSFCPYAYTLALADFDGDNRLDVFTLNIPAPRLPDGEYETWGSVLYGGGNGDFYYWEDYGFGIRPGPSMETAISIGFGDFFHTGRTDVVVLGQFSEYDYIFAVLRNNSETTPPPAMPHLNIDNATITEGNAGTVSATFTVMLSVAGSEAITVDYVTADGTATGSDYQAASGTLTFAPGEMSKTVTVLVNGDRVGESNETFFVNLCSPTNATIADGQGIGTILDDEPRISMNDVTVTEGNTGAVNATFTVSLSVAYDVAVTVHYQTANGSATAGSDYAAASRDVIIAAGQTTNTFTVAVIGDRSAEPTENFVVNLSAATNATIGDNQGICTIMDDEPRISISDVTRTEGRSGNTQFVFTVTLSAAYDQPVTMSYRTVNGTATTGNNDYVAQSGTLTFNPGQTSKTITIVVKGDSRQEADETFYLDLFGNSSNSLFTKNRGVGTILNDD